LESGTSAFLAKTTYLGIHDINAKRKNNTPECKRDGKNKILDAGLRGNVVNSKQTTLHLRLTDVGTMASI
jgi:hypothetical protein